MHRHALIIAGRPRALLASIFAASLALPAAAQEGEDEPEPGAANILDAGNDGTGIFHLNQAAADAANQHNILVAAVEQGTGAALADASASQVNQVALPSLEPIPPVATAALSAVGNDARGIVGINQSSAAGSTQGNLVGIALTSGEVGLASTSLAATAQAAQAQGVFGSGLGAASSASMRDFGNAAAGIVQANQSAGAAGVQSNLAAIAFSRQGFALADALAQAEAGEQGLDGLPAASGSVSLQDSFNGATGLVQLNQSAGGGNAQTNLLAAAFGAHASASALSEVSLGDLRPAAAGEGEAQEAEAGGQTALGNSFNGFSGIAQVSQVVGYGNQTANTVSVSISRGPGL